HASPSAMRSTRLKPGTQCCGARSGTTAQGEGARSSGSSHACKTCPTSCPTSRCPSQCCAAASRCLSLAPSPAAEVGAETGAHGGPRAMITVTINNSSAELPESMLLLSALRDRLGLTGAKLGCGEGACGACTVLADGEPIKSCQRTAGSVAGSAITTIE